MVFTLFALTALALGGINFSGAAVISCKCVRTLPRRKLHSMNVSLTASRAQRTRAGHQLTNGDR